MTDTTSRPDRRADYRRYPQAYFSLLSELERWLVTATPETQPVRLGPYERKQANTAKRDLYRFKMYLVNADPDDDYARTLATTFAEFTICMEAADERDKTGPHHLVFRPNPITVAMRARQEAQT